MTHEMNMSWLVLLMLGAFHGINPGMGWLFAVALGLQERRRSGVLAALLPLGLGAGVRPQSRFPGPEYDQHHRNRA